MNLPLQIYFIRHGETAWSLSGQHTGRTDLTLTPNGEIMARALAPWLAPLTFDLVLTSPRVRARTTCELAGLGSAAQIEPRLAEWDYGTFEGLRTTEIHAKHPDWDIWEDGCPEGEMPQEVGHRADQLIERLVQHHGKVALFAHGQFGRVLAARWIGLPVTQGKHFAIDPASVSILSSESAHPHRRLISLWNARPGTSL
jgi:broad specificity phosphatase PhoE